MGLGLSLGKKGLETRWSTDKHWVEACKAQLTFFYEWEVDLLKRARLSTFKRGLSFGTVKGTSEDQQRQPGVRQNISMDDSWASSSIASTIVLAERRR